MMVLELLIFSDKLLILFDFSKFKKIERRRFSDFLYFFWRSVVFLGWYFVRNF